MAPDVKDFSECEWSKRTHFVPSSPPFCNIDGENLETSGRRLTPSQMQSPLGMREKKREVEGWAKAQGSFNLGNPWYLWGQAQEGFNERTGNWAAISWPNGQLSYQNVIPSLSHSSFVIMMTQQENQSGGQKCDTRSHLLRQVICNYTMKAAAVIGSTFRHLS